MPSSVAGRLSFAGVKKSDSGEYGCAASNGIGFEIFATFKVGIWGTFSSTNMRSLLLDLPAF